MFVAFGDIRGKHILRMEGIIFIRQWEILFLVLEDKIYIRATSSVLLEDVKYLGQKSAEMTSFAPRLHSLLGLKSLLV